MSYSAIAHCLSTNRQKLFISNLRKDLKTFNVLWYKTFFFFKVLKMVWKCVSKRVGNISTTEPLRRAILINYWGFRDFFLLSPGQLWAQRPLGQSIQGNYLKNSLCCPIHIPPPSRYSRSGRAGSAACRLLPVALPDWLQGASVIMLMFILFSKICEKGPRAGFSWGMNST